LLAVPALLSLVAPGALAASLRALDLAGPGVSAEHAAGLLRPLLLASLATALLLALLPRLVRSGRLSPRAALLVAASLFLLDAGRRVTGTAPAGRADVYTTPTEEVRTAAEASRGGRFHVDGADDPERVLPLARERGGLDPLRPITGAVFGLRYGGDNDVDRMSPPGAVAFAAELARLPWGEEKVRRLRVIGARAARTSAPGQDPSGVREVGRFGRGRIVSIDETRPEYSFARRALFARPGLLAPVPPDPLVETVLEGTDPPLPFGAGEVAVLERTNHRHRLRVHVEPPGGLLVVARTWDRSWRARVDGVEVQSLRADGFLAAVRVPAGRHEVVFTYENPLVAAGAALTLVSLAVAGALLAAGRRHR
jgi:hypothetical protein